LPKTDPGLHRGDEQKAVPIRAIPKGRKQRDGSAADYDDGGVAPEYFTACAPVIGPETCAWSLM
jgi:hypothetical protein